MEELYNVLTEKRSSLKRFGQKVRAADGEIKNTQNCRLKGNESQ
jgi:hypothetical protein